MAKFCECLARSIDLAVAGVNVYVLAEFMDTNEWYYGSEGAQCGPVNEAVFHTLIADGTITPQTLVWKNGMADWQPLEMLGVKVGYPVAPYAPLYLGNPVVAPTSGLAIASLVCGIVGILTCFVYVPGICGLAAVICGHMGMSQIGKSPVLMGGKGMCVSGLIMGYLAILLQLMIIIAGVLFFTQVIKGSPSSFRSFTSP